MFLPFLILTLIISILIAVAFLRTLADTVKSISPENQKIDPVKIWWLLIPIFNYYWHFVVVNKLSQSIKAEYTQRNIPTEERPTYTFGLSTAIAMIISVIFSIINILQLEVIYNGLYIVIRGFISLASITIWIVYWIQVTQHKKTIKNLRLNTQNLP